MPKLLLMSVSTPLGPFRDNVVDWGPWVSLMSLFGLLALPHLVTTPLTRRIGGSIEQATQRRLNRWALFAAVFGVLTLLVQLAYEAGKGKNFVFGQIWDQLTDGVAGGLHAVTLLGVGLATVLLIEVTRLNTKSRGEANAVVTSAHNALTCTALVASALALMATKFPSSTPTDWPRTIFSTAVWFAHLLGAGFWLGGLAGLFALLLPGAVPKAQRAAFWGPAVRRFSALAMGSVAAISLSGLWLYWTHVDGLSQLVSTMYGRVLGVKIVIFGSVLLLGVFNQFWLEPRLAQLRHSGDDESTMTLLLRHFRITVACEVLLVTAVLFVAPFLHGSARNQAFQQTYVDKVLATQHNDSPAQGAVGPAPSKSAKTPKKIPKIPTKQVDWTTWAYGIGETGLVVGGMFAAWRFSGRLARRRIAASTVSHPAPDPSGRASEDELAPV